jgi:dissimilatory sulfite reductase (desulfoviridin) alpha/beta subunit
MKWDKAAASEFVKMPIAKSAKENTKVFAEKLARKNHRDRVTLSDIEAAKKVTYEDVPEEKRHRELQKRIAEGETDLMQRIEQEGREILAREIDLFNVEMCHAQYFRCRCQLIEVREIKREIERKLRELNVSQMMADSLPDDERIMAHHRFTVSISGCPNGCTGPETRPFALHGVCQPVITDVTCSECLACVRACRRGAIAVLDGIPEISAMRCDLCGSCTRACPTGKITAAAKGYRILVGGKFGRFHQVGTQLFRIADKDTLINAMEAALKTIKEESVGHEDLTSIINRIGVAPIFERLYRGNGRAKKTARTKSVSSRKPSPSTSASCPNCGQ